MTSPADARGWHHGGFGHGGFGWGPGIGFGLVAGALAAGAYGAYGPYGYGYGYEPVYDGYYAPAYYGYAPAYYGGPYAYYPRHRYYRRHYYYRGW
nr:MULTISPECIES: hypothetical protein [Afipia]